MSIEKKPFGQLPTGEKVTCYTMTNGRGESVSLLNLGANIAALKVRGENGTMADVVTGFDTLEGYLKPHGCMGDTIGRYGNRIARGEFTLEGVAYHLARNNGENHLHGGPAGFATRLWDAAVQPGDGLDRVIFHRISPDGEEGYPGTLDVTVTYTWDDAGCLAIRYQAATDRTTHCNLTNHAYFNLAGHDAGTVADHWVKICADVTTRVDEGLIPTGDYCPVAGTPMALEGNAPLGDLDQRSAGNQQMQFGHGGFDHNYVLRKGSAMGLAAEVRHPGTGRCMRVLTDQPGVQFYTANTTNIPGGKGGAVYGRHSSFCLETQHFPDTPNQSGFPSTILRPGETYDTTTIYQFLLLRELEG